MYSQVSESNSDSQQVLHDVGDDQPQLFREDVKRGRFPFTIVWTPLPLISWFLPFIGHLGICDSEGKVHDFAGPYYIGIDDFAFGHPTKILRLSPDRVQGVSGSTRDKIQFWNESVAKGDAVYRNMMHNLCCNNCHSHVARCMNIMKYEGKTNWNMVSVWWRITLRGTYVNAFRFVETYLGFVILATIILVIYLVTRFV